MIRKYIIPAIAWIILRTLWLTWRITLREPDSLKNLIAQRKPFILTHWHGDELVLLNLMRRYKLATIASNSKDGESMNTLIKLLGGVTSRGSSTRGGVQALKGLIRLIRNGHPTCFAVDGPKGPIYKVKPGVFEVSRIIQCPIFWVGVSSNKSWIFQKSWNKTYIPKPWAHIIIEWHGPMEPVTSNEDPRSPELALKLESQLNAAKQLAAKEFDVNNA